MNGVYEEYLKRMTKSKEGKALFEEYKRIYGKYPPRYVDATEEEIWKEIRQMIEDTRN
ncbi:hypothetical protein [Listeria seeligeri]|uniref:hypothetical protein n=1 Tax=Listeria seeligeri TaxID=1640 RepID=UPI00162A80F9|nr:hypothetical protein [Listeria seeligeri]MBC1722259.1 hypothetical protein [Listeria seeligeri]MBF2435786.1 hypothetical protein [Listeria seeligeri]